MKKDVGPVARDQVVVDPFKRLGVDRHPVHLIVGHMRRTGLRGFKNFERQAPVDDLLLVAHRAPCGHERARAHPAQRPGGLDQEGLRSLPRRRRRRRAAGRPAPDDDDIVGGVAGDLSCRKGLRQGVWP